MATGTTRTVNFLPEIFQTPTNKQFLAATLDVLTQQPKLNRVQGFIGQNYGYSVASKDKYVIEPTITRQNYQLPPAVTFLKPDTQTATDFIDYPGIVKAFGNEGAITDNNDRLFEQEFYSWDPFINMDKIVNYGQYYWIPSGPDSVLIEQTPTPTTQIIDVIRGANGYIFSNLTNQDPNEPFALVRGGTYEFVINQGDVPFWIQGVVGLDGLVPQTTISARNVYGVTNNGTSFGTIEFTVPFKDAQEDEIKYGDYEVDVLATVPFSSINGQTQSSSTPITVDGVTLSNGTTLIFYNNGDATTQNNFYTVSINSITNVITLVPGDLIFNDTKITIRNGNDYRGQSFYKSSETYLITNIPYISSVLDTIYYQDGVNPDFYSEITILENNITNNLNVNTIIGRKQYVSPNNIIFTNGLKIRFNRNVTPSIYADKEFYVEGVGTSINLLPVTDFEIPETQNYATAYRTEEAGWDIYFDPLDQADIRNEGWSKLPWSGTRTIIGTDIDYITISRNSRDRNAWTRSNRWFHQDVIDTVMAVNGYISNTPLNVPTRAQRPIIEYEENLELFNSGQTIGGVNLCSTKVFDAFKTIQNASILSYSISNIIKGTVTVIETSNATPFVDGDLIIITEVIGMTQINLKECYVKINPDTTISLYTDPQLTIGLDSNNYNNYISGGSIQYNYFIDGVQPGENDTVIFINDVNDIVRKTVYRVSYLPDPTNPLDLLISFNPLSGIVIEDNDEIFIRAGNTNAGLSFVYNSVTETWKEAQVKLKLNQYPLFDIYDVNGYSLSDELIYPLSTFVGTELFSYTRGTGADDPVLGFPIAYSSVGNIGDINFTINYNSQTFTYRPVGSTSPVTRNINISGYVYYRPTATTIDKRNGWVPAEDISLQYQTIQFQVQDFFGKITNITRSSVATVTTEAAHNFINGTPVILTDVYGMTEVNDSPYFARVIDAFNIELYADPSFITPINSITFNNYAGGGAVSIRGQYQFVCDVPVATNTTWDTLQIYVGEVLRDSVSYDYYVDPITQRTVITLTDPIALPGEKVTVLIASNRVSSNGYYQVPTNLQNNPFNEIITAIDLGDIRNQYTSIYQNTNGVIGPIYGNNNIHNLGNLNKNGTQIIQNSASLVLPGVFVRKPQLNLFNALQYSNEQYYNYKQLITDLAGNGEYTVYQSAAEILDDIISSIAATKTSQSFFWSDMLPSGNAYRVNSYYYEQATNEVDIVLNQTYDFTTANYNGLCIYLRRSETNNGQDIQLIRNQDYFVSDISPTVTITYPLQAGETIIIKEYNQTYGSYCPNTPTKLGMYSVFKPQIIVDTTYNPATTFLQGHDGSYTKLYGDYNFNTQMFTDFRDSVMFEFELRIFNNLKLSGEQPLIAADVIPGQFRDTGYSYEEILSIYSTNFLNWVGLNRIDYKTQQFSQNNQFSWNYNQSSNKLINPNIQSDTALKQGYWRGIYRWLYDTDEPNLRPWEMLGFSQKPTWWDEYYNENGSNIYTSDNTLLWNDLARGFVYNGGNSYIDPLRVRPQLLDVIPVDAQGNLLSPFEVVVSNYDRLSFERSWVVGDQAPAETAYLKSSSWPFDLVRLLALTKPAQFFNYYVDMDSYKYNPEQQQYLYNDYVHLDPRTLEIYGNGTAKTSYINWVVDYIYVSGVDAYTTVKSTLENLDVRLTYRLAGFSDKTYLNFLVERATPDNNSNSLRIPDDSFQVILYDDVPDDKIVYSGIIITKLQLGWSVSGFSQSTNYFTVAVPKINGTNRAITVGNTTVSVSSEYYEGRTSIVPYGTVFYSVQGLSEFIQNYGRHLSDQGVGYDVEAGYSTTDWNLMINRFISWTQQSWEVGSVVTLNPLASVFSVNTERSIVQPLTIHNQNFILNQNLLPIPQQDLAIIRENTLFSAKTLNSGDVFAYTSLNVSTIEHAVIFDNYTVFNDTIYNTNTGLRQSRLLMNGYITAEWNGFMDAQGFIINQNNIQEWQPYVKYTKGQIVTLKGFYWVANSIIEPTQQFNENQWTKTPSDTVKLGILPNPSAQAYESSLFYDINNANLEKDSDLLSFSLIGYRPRPYMAAADLSDVTQINVYKNILEQKGTNLLANSFKAAEFAQGKLDYDLQEVWAIKNATFGSVLNSNFVDILLNQNLLNNNPSVIGFVGAVVLGTPVVTNGVITSIPVLNGGSNYDTPPTITIVGTNTLPAMAEAILLDGTVSSIRIITGGSGYTSNVIAVASGGGINGADQTISIDEFINYEIKPLTPNFLPEYPNNYLIEPGLPSAGYVNLNDVKVTSFSIAELNDVPANYTGLYRKNNVWIANYNGSWGIFAPDSIDTQVVRVVNNLNNTITIHFNGNHGLVKNDIFSVNNFNDAINRYHTVNSVQSTTSVIVVYDLNQSINELTGYGFAMKLVTQRVAEPKNLGDIHVQWSEFYSKLFWVDSDVDGSWAVYKNSPSMVGTVPEITAETQMLGKSVLSKDGFGVFTAALVEGQGKIYRTYNNVTTELPSPVGDVNYGSGMAASNNRLFVSSTYAIYVYTRNANDGLTLSQTIVLPFNSAALTGELAVSENGNWLYAAAAGIVYVFGINNISNGYELSNIISGEVSENFGSSIATSITGQKLIVGASNATNGTYVGAGVVYVYSRGYNRWETNGQLTTFDLNDVPENQNTIKVYINGSLQPLSSYTLVSRFLSFTTIPEVGSVIEVEFDTVIRTSVLGSGSVQQFSQFGVSVSTNRYGSDIIIGSPGEVNVVDGAKSVQGAAYLFINGGQRYGSITGTTPPQVNNNNLLIINGSQILFAQSSSAENIAEQINQQTPSNIVASVDDNDLLTINVLRDTAEQKYNIIDVVATEPVLNSLGIKTYYNPNTSGTALYTNIQRITSLYKLSTGNFGSSVAMNETSGVVISAPLATNFTETTFDFTDDFDNNDTIFDNGSTIFVEQDINTGAVYEYQYLPAVNESLDNTGKYIFGQSLTPVIDVNTLSITPQFGRNISFSKNTAVVGSPTLLSSNVGSTWIFDGGAVSTWDISKVAAPTVNINSLQYLALYNNTNNETLEYLNYIDPVQGKLLGAISTNLDYIQAADPASYSDIRLSWGAKQVGETWLNTTNLRILNYHQPDLEYNAKYWAQPFPGSSADIYTWVESTDPPLDYNGPGYVTNFDNYVEQQSLDNSTDSLVTTYYYWVKNYSEVPLGKTLSPITVSQYILNPQSSGIPYVAPLKTNSVAFYNCGDYIMDTSTAFHLGYAIGENTPPASQTWSLINDNSISSFLDGLPPTTAEEPSGLYLKLLDSFSGRNVNNQLVPDPLLPPLVKYGVSTRPLQSMFPDRKVAIDNYLSWVNDLLLSYRVTLTRSFSLLNTSGTINGVEWDTKDYWTYTNWWATGYDNNTKADIEVPRAVALYGLTPFQGMIARVETNAQGFGETYRWTVETGWYIIGLDRGTIQFNISLLQEDNQKTSPAIRSIIRWVNEVFFTQELISYKNKGLILIFNIIVGSAQQQGNYLPWLNKTSFMDVSHNIRQLREYKKFQRDNTEFLMGYLNEIKPYHVVIKDFLFKYDGFEPYAGSITDFDLPSEYNNNYGRFISPRLVYNPNQIEIGDYPFTSSIWTTPAYTDWFQNFGLSINNSEVANVTVTKTKTVISDSTDTIQVVNTYGMPENGIVTIENEQILYLEINRYTNTLLHAVRGYNSTDVTSHPANSPVSMDLPAVIVLDPGRGYRNRPVITVSIDTNLYPPPSQVAELQAVMGDPLATPPQDQTKLYSVTVNAAGAGYAIKPTITIEPSIVSGFSSGNPITNVITLDDPTLQTGDSVVYRGNKTTGPKNLTPNSYYYIRVEQCDLLLPEWISGDPYSVGDVVRYRTSTNEPYQQYTCIDDTSSTTFDVSSWSQTMYVRLYDTYYNSITPAVAEWISIPSGEVSPVNEVTYNSGDVVQYNGFIYECTQFTNSIEFDEDSWVNIAPSTFESLHPPVEIGSTGVGSLNVTPRLAVFTVNKPAREIKTTIKFDRTTYNSNILPWNSSVSVTLDVSGGVSATAKTLTVIDSGTLPQSGVFTVPGGTFTVSAINSINNTLTVSSTDYLNVGNSVVFTGTESAPIYGGLVDGKTYYILTINVATNSIQISETVNGPVFDVLAGSGSTFTGTRESEQIKFDNVDYSTNTMYNVQRGFNNTLAQPHADGTVLTTVYNVDDLVLYPPNQSRRLYKCITTNTDDDFNYDNWIQIFANDPSLTAADRVVAFYKPTINMPGVDITQLMSGVEYPNNTYQGFSLDAEREWDVSAWDSGRWENSVVNTKNDTNLMSPSFVPTTYQTNNNYVDVQGTPFNFGYGPEELVAGLTYDVIDINVKSKSGSTWDERAITNNSGDNPNSTRTPRLLNTNGTVIITDTSSVNNQNESMFFQTPLDYIESPYINTEFNFNNNQSFTIEFWMFPVSQQNSQIFSTAQYNTVNGWSVGVTEDNRITFTSSNQVDGISAYTTPTNVFNLNSWVNVSIVREGTILTAYVGQLPLNGNTSWVNTAYRMISSVGISNVTIATPGVVTTISNHNLNDGEAVSLVDINDIPIDQILYAKNITINTFELYTDHELTVPYTTTGVYINGGTVIRGGYNSDGTLNPHSDLTFPNPSPISISVNIDGITQSPVATVTTNVAHNLIDGESISINGVVGMTEVNGNTYYVKTAGYSLNSFGLYEDGALTLAVNSTAFGAYISGGQITITNPQSTIYIARGYSINPVPQPNFSGAVESFNGNLQELRISNINRYDDVYQPQTYPFANDNNTLLLVHPFAIDDSEIILDDAGTNVASTGFGVTRFNSIVTVAPISFANIIENPVALDIYITSGYTSYQLPILVSGVVSGTVYSIDWVNQTITFDTSEVAVGTTIQIALYEFGGGNQLNRSNSNLIPLEYVPAETITVGGIQTVIPEHSIIEIDAEYIQFIEPTVDNKFNTSVVWVSNNNETGNMRQLVYGLSRDYYIEQSADGRNCTIVFNGVYTGMYVAWAILGWNQTPYVYISTTPSGGNTQITLNEPNYIYNVSVGDFITFDRGQTQYRVVQVTSTYIEIFGVLLSPIPFGNPMWYYTPVNGYSVPVKETIRVPSPPTSNTYALTGFFDSTADSDSVIVQLNNTRLTPTTDYTISVSPSNTGEITFTLTTPLLAYDVFSVTSFVSLNQQSVSSQVTTTSIINSISAISYSSGPSIPVIVTTTNVHGITIGQTLLVKIDGLLQTTTPLNGNYYWAKATTNSMVELYYDELATEPVIITFNIDYNFSRLNSEGLASYMFDADTFRLDQPNYFNYNDSQRVFVTVNGEYIDHSRIKLGVNSHHNIHASESTITNISQSLAGVVSTDGAYNLAEGQQVKISGVTPINYNGTYYIKLITETSFALYSDPGLTVSVDTLGYPMYSSGGVVSDIIQYGGSEISILSPVLSGDTVVITSICPSASPNVETFRIGIDYENTPSVYRTNWDTKTYLTQTYNNLLPTPSDALYVKDVLKLLDKEVSTQTFIVGLVPVDTRVVSVDGDEITMGGSSVEKTNAILNKYISLNTTAISFGRGFDIQAISNSNPARITFTESHDFVNEQKILITGVNGMTELNGNTYYVKTVVGADNQIDLYTDLPLTNGVNSTTFGLYTDGGVGSHQYLVSQINENVITLAETPSPIPTEGTELYVVVATLKYPVLEVDALREVNITTPAGGQISEDSITEIIRPGNILELWIAKGMPGNYIVTTFVGNTVLVNGEYIIFREYSIADTNAQYIYGLQRGVGKTRVNTFLPLNTVVQSVLQRDMLAVGYYDQLWYDYTGTPLQINDSEVAVFMRTPNL